MQALEQMRAQTDAALNAAAIAQQVATQVAQNAQTAQTEHSRGGTILSGIGAKVRICAVVTFPDDAERALVDHVPEGGRREQLDPELNLELTTVGPSKNRRFPALVITTNIARKPEVPTRP